MGARRIGIVSVGRSDAGHLSPLFALLPDAQRFWYQAAPVSTPADVAQGFGLAAGNFTHQYRYSQGVDLLVVFGDRWEQLAAASAAHLMNIPIVHLHAGEATEAVVDDGCRAAISALATIHVTAAWEYAVRLMDQGYRRVYNLGAPGLARLVPKPSLSVGPEPVVLVTFHPETLNLSAVAAQAAELNAALELIGPAEIIVTDPGMDAGRDAIREALKDRRTLSYTDDEWVKTLAYADVIVGNSSCGIIEAPSVPLPSVNIGDRQKGRLHASSVIQVAHDRDAIRAGIALALNPEWRRQNLTGENPYGDRHAAERIADLLQTVEL